MMKETPTKAQVIEKNIPLRSEIILATEKNEMLMEEASRRAKLRNGRRERMTEWGGGGKNLLISQLSFIHIKHTQT